MKTLSSHALSNEEGSNLIIKITRRRRNNLIIKITRSNLIIKKNNKYTNENSSALKKHIKMLLKKQFNRTQRLKSFLSFSLFLSFCERRRRYTLDESAVCTRLGIIQFPSSPIDAWSLFQIICCLFQFHQAEISVVTRQASYPRTLERDEGWGWTKTSPSWSP